MMMQGKTVLVTGATSGIGFFTARAIAVLGARVFITGRDAERGSQAASEIREYTRNTRVHFLAAEHSTVNGNRDLARRMTVTGDALDVLVNNAGGGGLAERSLTEDGFELNVAMNAVGPFVLTHELLPLIRSGRIVNINSSAHAMWKGDPFGDVQSAERYVGIEAHARAKLLNMLWTFALARRLAGTGASANAVNPGMAWTRGTAALTRDAIPAWKAIWPVVRWFQRRASAERAARAPTFLASSPTLASLNGAYFESSSRPARPSAYSLDPGNQERAFALLEQLARAAR
jgi:NAD(P)-dependent dehydrogenase (short-subunit alcohol dehydrogenase family)